MGGWAVGRLGGWAVGDSRRGLALGSWDAQGTAAASGEQSSPRPGELQLLGLFQAGEAASAEQERAPVRPSAHSAPEHSMCGAAGRGPGEGREGPLEEREAGEGHPEKGQERQRVTPEEVGPLEKGILERAQTHEVCGSLGRGRAWMGWEALRKPIPREEPIEGPCTEGRDHTGLGGAILD